MARGDETRMESEVTTELIAVSFERTPLLEVSVKAAAIEALGWREYDRLPHRWIVKYERVGLRGDHDSADEIEELMDEYWVDPTELGPDDLATE